MGESMKVKVSDVFNNFPDFEKDIKIKKSDKPRSLSLKETKNFHKKKSIIGKIIIKVMDKRETIYGARALNARLPNYLDRHTKDFDIYTPTPYRDARETENALDKAFGGDFFFVTEAEHRGTWKVKAHATGETYADYTKEPKELKRENLHGLFYPTMGFIEKGLRKTLHDPMATHRHQKDKDALNRLLLLKRRLY